MQSYFHLIWVLDCGHYNQGVIKKAINYHYIFLAAVKKLLIIIALQGRNHGKFLAATSAMVVRICPPWLG